MDVQLVGRHLEVTPSIRNYALEKVERLGKYFEGISRVKVNLSFSSGIHCTELIFSVIRGQILVAHAEDADLYASIDAAVGKGERQLTKFKEKIKDKKVKGTFKETRPSESEIIEDEEDEEDM